MIDDPRDLHAMEEELARLQAERDKVHSDLHNTGDLKYQHRLEVLNAQILELERAMADGRV